MNRFQNRELGTTTNVTSVAITRLLERPNHVGTTGTFVPTADHSVERGAGVTNAVSR